MVTWNQVSWKDPRLGWNPEENENLQVVRFHKDQIWIPDITNFHAVDEVKNIGPEPSLVTVMPDGSVFLAPMERHTVSLQISYEIAIIYLICNLDLDSPTEHES